jgi:hypothetical protein
VRRRELGGVPTGRVVAWIFGGHTLRLPGPRQLTVRSVGELATCAAEVSRWPMVSPGLCLGVNHIPDAKGSTDIAARKTDSAATRGFAGLRSGSAHGFRTGECLPFQPQIPDRPGGNRQEPAREIRSPAGPCNLGFGCGFCEVPSTPRRNQRRPGPSHRCSPPP